MFMSFRGLFVAVLMCVNYAKFIIPKHIELLLPSFFFSFFFCQKLVFGTVTCVAVAFSVQLRVGNF